MRARRPVLAENVGGRERFDLIIVGECKSEQVGRCREYYCRLMSGRVVLLGSAQWLGLVVQLNRVLATSSECAVDKVCGSERRVR